MHFCYGLSPTGKKYDRLPPPAKKLGDRGVHHLVPRVRELRVGRDHRRYVGPGPRFHEGAVLPGGKPTTGPSLFFFTGAVITPRRKNPEGM